MLDEQHKDVLKEEIRYSHRASVEMRFVTKTEGAN